MNLHKNLNPKLWDEDRLNPKVRKLLLKICDLWLKFCKVKKTYVKDIILTGSNANYNYTDLSDVDVHIVVDKSVFDCDEFIDEYFVDKKKLFTDAYQLHIHSHTVELFFQDYKEEIVTNQGVFSLISNSWIRKPTRNYPIPNDNLIIKKAKMFYRMILLVLKTNNIKKIKSLKNRIRNYRKSGLTHEGEYSVENLVYKKLRRTKIFQKIDDKIAEIIHRKYSI